jgi:DNA-binding NtrC family response regulator
MKNHILVIDDDPALLAVLREYLQINDFKVTSASTCDEALSLSPAQLEALGPFDPSTPFFKAKEIYGAIGMPVQRIHCITVRTIL